MAYTKSYLNDIYANYFKNEVFIVQYFCYKNNISFYFQIKCNDELKTTAPHFDNSVWCLIHARLIKGNTKWCKKGKWHDATMGNCALFYLSNQSVPSIIKDIFKNIDIYP